MCVDVRRAFVLSRVGKMRVDARRAFVLFRVSKCALMRVALFTQTQEKGRFPFSEPLSISARPEFKPISAKTLAESAATK